MSGVIGITVFGTNYFINLQQSIVIEMTKQKNLTFSFNTLVSDLTLHFFFLIILSIMVRRINIKKIIITWAFFLKPFCHGKRHTHKWPVRMHVCPTHVKYFKISLISFNCVWLWKIKHSHNSYVWFSMKITIIIKKKKIPS